MKTITVTFTDGKFEKSVTAKTKKEAEKIARDVAYWPIEISDYSRMEKIITVQKNDEEYSYYIH